MTTIPLIAPISSYVQEYEKINLIGDFIRNVLIVIPREHILAATLPVDIPPE
jgi:hypothetical protein